MSSSSL
ncbi:cc171c44-8f0f-45bf-bed7-6d156ecbac52 [Thermothielavioides terrestris]|nr:cc171c44-8f0f-45bf-bed7-6d156ecbac52 [Thermothielavioides terrestris]